MASPASLMSPSCEKSSRRIVSCVGKLRGIVTGCLGKMCVGFKGFAGGGGVI